jgi:spore cortex formation protein SpoVR/YcgB (stage V sporulation)
MRDMRLFEISDESDSNFYKVSSIHNNEGYKKVRQSLSEFYNRSRYIPDIQVYNVDVYGNRSLTLEYTPLNDRELDINEVDKVLPHIKYLWGFPVKMVQRGLEKLTVIATID